MELLRISKTMEHSSPVFIVGDARSGTSMLYRVLQNHSSFRPRKLNLDETHIFKYLPVAFLFRPGSPSRLFNFMLRDEEQYTRFLATIGPLRPFGLLMYGPYRMMPTSLRLWRTGMSHLVLRSYIYHAQAARGCTRLIEKTPRNLPHMAKIMTGFPRAKMLYICRHPIDVFSSYRKRWPRSPTSTSPERFSRMYAHSIRLVAKQASENPRSLFFVRYEDFTQRPQDELGRICTYLGEPYEEGALIETNPNPAHRNPHLFGEITTRTKDWREFVTADEAASIQDRLESTMGILNYPRYT